MTENALLEVDRLRKVYPARGIGGEETIAIDEVSFRLAEGGSLGIVGESGAGKTTVARILIGLERPTSGRVLLGGKELDPAPSLSERRARARLIQMVFQDPYTSLDPRQSVGAAVDEILRIHFNLSREARAARVRELLEGVGLAAEHESVRPRRLSGGQRQRVAIVRALAAEPRVLLLDEHVAALDVSIQAQILNLLADIRRETGLTYLTISHDLAVVRQSTQYVVVMRDGSVVETGPTLQVLDAPAQDYTRRLRDAVPRPDWKPRRTSTVVESDAAGEAQS